MGAQDYVPLYKNEAFAIVCAGTIVKVFEKYFLSKTMRLNRGRPGGFCPTFTQIIKGQMQLTIDWLQLGRTYFILPGLLAKPINL